LRSAVSRACDKGEYRNQKTQERDQQIAPFVLPHLYKTAPECERVAPHQRHIYRKRLLAPLDCVLDHLPKPRLGGYGRQWVFAVGLSIDCNNQITLLQR